MDLLPLYNFLLYDDLVNIKDTCDDIWKQICKHSENNWITLVINGLEEQHLIPIKNPSDGVSDGQFESLLCSLTLKQAVTLRPVSE